MEEQLVMRINEILESNKIDDRDKKTYSRSSFFI